MSATGREEIKAARRAWQRVEGAQDRPSSRGNRRESRANYSMAVVGYSMRLANETESECEKTERKRGKEEKRKRLIEKVQNRKYRRGQLIGWIGTSLTPASGNDGRRGVGFVGQYN